jgi:hypothetical protein
MTTSAARQANIRTQAGNRPFIPAAWMRFSQTHNIVKLNIWEHNSNWNWDVKSSNAENYTVRRLREDWPDAAVCRRKKRADDLSAPLSTSG